MEGGSYLHFNITNMVTIWIIVSIGFVALGAANKVWKSKSGA